MVQFLRETYEEARRRGGPAGPYGRGPDLVAMLWGIPGPESAGLLLRMLRDGSQDLRLMDAYVAVAGNASVQELRRLSLSPPNDMVRYGVRRALLRYKDPETVRRYLEELRPCGTSPVQVQYLYDIIDWAPQANLTEAIPPLRRLYEHYRTSGPVHLRRRIIHALLQLGDWSSVPAAIDVVEQDAAAGEMAPESYGDVSAALRRVTGQWFGADVKKWRQWWDEKGRHRTGPEPPEWADAFLQPAEAEAIERAFLEWAMTPAGAVVPGPVVYVQDQGGRRRSTETIRYYREAALSLLDVPRIRIDSVSIHDDRARVSFYGPGDFHGPGPTVELVRRGGGWSVVGHVPAEPVDDRNNRL